VTALLVSIQHAIDARVSATVEMRPDWPCRAGCDHCCRHLARIPELTEPEWALLAAGIRALHTPVQRIIAERIQALDSESYPFTCPLLDAASGRCLTYEQRPIACRTYGFYVDRREGLYCDQIRTLADSGQLEGVIWGSQAGVEERSAALGATRSLVDWFKRHSSGG
jgi:Fe-S-cluster containining protein